MATISGIDEITTRTLDGLSSIDVDTIIINGQPFDPTDYLNKLTDTSDDIVEGIAQLFLTPTERADIAANTAARHDPVTLGTANGLSIGGMSGQELSLAIADATTTGALSNADWVTFNGKQDPITVSTPLTFIANNVAIPQASAVQDGYLSATDFTAFASGGAWSVNTAPTPDVVYVTDTTRNVAIGSTTVPTSAIRLFVNGTTQANDVYATGSLSADTNLYIGALSTITADPVQIKGNIRTETGSLTVGGAGSFAGQLSVTNNAANSRFIGTDHCYQEFYPRGVSAGRQAYLGYGGSNVRDLSLINQDTGRLDLGTNSTARMTILNGGYVGIGTTNPAQLLEVQKNNNGGVDILVSNNSTGTSAYAEIALGTNNSYGVLFKNGGNKTSDGGANAMTLRNDLGDLRLQSQGAVGIRVAASSGIVYQANGDNSWTEYGPNTTWSSKLRVGATPDVSEAATAQVISTNGNLHCDAGRDRNMYMNYYASLSVDDNDYYQCSRATYCLNVPLGRIYESPRPIRLVQLHWKNISSVYYSPAVNTWGVITPLSLLFQPLRTSSRFLIRVKLSVALYGESSVAFRITRNGAPIETGIGGVNSGHSRMCGIGTNQDYWMVPPTYIELLDHPATTSPVTYAVEYMTYATTYGFRLNYVRIGGQGGDATAVTSSMVVEERAYGEYTGF